MFLLLSLVGLILGTSVLYLLLPSGVPPRIMGVGPEFAIKQLLDATGIKTEEVDLYEVWPTRERVVHCAHSQLDQRSFRIASSSLCATTRSFSVSRANYSHGVANLRSDSSVTK